MLPGRNEDMVTQTPVGTVNIPKGEPATGRQVNIAELWARLGDEDRVPLPSNLMDGLVDARLTVMEVSRSASPATSARSVLASLDRAIRELSRARELLARRAQE